jgi:hypothetical protein
LSNRYQRLVYFTGSLFIFAASIKPQTAKAKQLTPGTRNNIFQYGVVKIEDIIANVTNSATTAAANCEDIKAVVSPDVIGITCSRTDSGFRLKHIHKCWKESGYDAENKPECSHCYEINLCRVGVYVFHFV